MRSFTSWICRREISRAARNRATSAGTWAEPIVSRFTCGRRFSTTRAFPMAMPEETPIPR